MSIVSVAFLALRHVADYDDVVWYLIRRAMGYKKGTALPVGAAFAVKYAFSPDPEHLAYNIPSTT